MVFPISFCSPLRNQSSTFSIELMELLEWVIGQGGNFRFIISNNVFMRRTPLMKIPFRNSSVCYLAVNFVKQICIVLPLNFQLQLSEASAGYVIWSVCDSCIWYWNIFNEFLVLIFGNIIVKLLILIKKRQN